MALAFATLAGCATTSAPPGGSAASSAPAIASVPSAPAGAPASPLETGRAIAGSPVNHAYHGRFAVHYTDANGQDRDAYGNFSWRDNAGTVALQLRNPLGQALAMVEASERGATLELPGKPPRSAPDVEQLLHDALGFALPVDGLKYWLLPAPAPGSSASTVPPTSPGRPLAPQPAQIRQDGWTIDYLAYAQPPASGVKRVNLTRRDPPLQVKLVLDQ